MSSGSLTEIPHLPQGSPSLPESNRTVPIPGAVSRIKKFLAFAGPAYLVSVGYMDPGNWATDLLGGSKFGYALLWVILASNLMAIFLQTLSAKLGIVTGRDLAQACRDYYKRPAAVALWLLCEIAIIACDLAEVIGSAVALQLLFHMPLIVGVLLTSFDVLAILGLMKFGFRKLEAVVLVLVGTVAACFALEMVMAKPDWMGVVGGLFTPSLPTPQIGEGGSLVIALGILGATVMPHNLYLHSAVVQTRDAKRTPDGLRESIRYNMIDTVVALGMAFFVNAAILVLAAATFHKTGQEVSELQDAHRLLDPLLGPAASVAFAVALLASGQSSTITGTLAGQIVMEGFLNIRIAPWLRRLITRSLAIIPAIILIVATGGKDTVNLLLLSQVVLSMQLSFAIFPLVMFTSDKRKMGEFANSPWVTVTGYIIGTIIASLNLYLLWETASEKLGMTGQILFAATVLFTIAFALWVRFFYKEKTVEDNNTNKAGA